MAKNSCFSLKKAIEEGNLEGTLAMKPSGQVVIPQKARVKAGLNPGEKLMIVLESEKAVKYLYLVKANSFYLLARPLLQLFLKKLEGVTEVDSRGQIVIPLKARQQAGIKEGEKVSFVTQFCQDKLCCISLVRNADLPKILA